MQAVSATVALLAVGWTVPASAQEPAPPPPEQTVGNATGKCLEPPPLLLRWEDYHGPYQKLIATFARKVERKSASPPRYKPGTALCSLEVKASSNFS